MQLSTYLAQKRATVADLARALNVSHATALHWYHRRRTPRPARIAEIKAWSNGAVTAEDWLPVAVAAEKAA